MIVGRAICKLFEGMSVVNGTVNVQNNYGNQDALDKFIALSNKKGVQKYPLIFYVINEVKTIDKNWRTVETDLIIMMNTNSDMLYKERTDKVYVKYIEPIYKEIERILTVEPYIQVIGNSLNEKFRYIDFPNYGIVKGSVGDSSSAKSVVTDYVDARVIKINFRINTDCI